MLVMLVGPSCIGKSTIMDALVSKDKRFSYVRSFTTRAQRSYQDTSYNFISKEQASKLYENGEAITFLEHPTTGDIYGTTAESYATQFNILDTLSESVATYRSLPFKQTITISLTADPSDWQAWFYARYPEHNQEVTKRLEEAVLSISWSIQDTLTHWIVNKEGDIESNVEAILEICNTNSVTTSTPPVEAHGLLEAVESMLAP